ncbi:MAG: helix-turn-helix domain-containing protein [Nevskiales bacterium]
MTTANDRIQWDDPSPGLQRLVARFAGHAYDPHRHETYAIGLTVSGVQAFRYRGVEHASIQGQTLVLHPDELHDGHAGDTHGFSYRMIYVEPWLLSHAMPVSHRLPFVRDAVAWDSAIAELVTDAFEGFPGSVEPFATDSLIAGLADALMSRVGCRMQRSDWLKAKAEVERARDMLASSSGLSVKSSDLERVTGLDRFTLARAFRAIVGTSPHRYLVGRRLIAARSLIARGEPLSDVAARVGFADQSHLTRHFKSRFGITPGRAASLLQSHHR